MFSRRAGIFPVELGLFQTSWLKSQHLLLIVNLFDYIFQMSWPLSKWVCPVQSSWLRGWPTIFLCRRNDTINILFTVLLIFLYCFINLLFYFFPDELVLSGLVGPVPDELGVEPAHNMNCYFKNIFQMSWPCLYALKVKFIYSFI